MLFDSEMIGDIYRAYPGKIANARKLLNRSLPLIDKILYAHLFDNAGHQ